MTRCVDRVPLGVLEKHDCSAAAPCWALVKAETPLAPLDGGTQLSSVSSIALLRTHSYGTGCAQSAPRSLRGVLNHDIVTALFAMDPMSYLFAYRTADSTVRYRPRPPTAQSQVGLRPLCAPRPPLAPPRHLLLTCARARAPTRARALTRALTRALSRAPARTLTLTPFQPPSLSATSLSAGRYAGARRCIGSADRSASHRRLLPVQARAGTGASGADATSLFGDLFVGRSVRAPNTPPTRLPSWCGPAIALDARNPFVQATRSCTPAAIPAASCAVRSARAGTPFAARPPSPLPCPPCPAPCPPPPPALPRARPSRCTPLPWPPLLFLCRCPLP